MMKRFRQTLHALVLGLSLCFSLTLHAQTANPLKGKKVLVFSKTAGFRHGSIPSGQKAIMEFGKQYGFDVDTSENAAVFNEKNLKKYRLVVFLNTTGNILNAPQQIDFERFIQSGGGYVGIHAATDTEYDWPWYGKLAGGYFASHPGNPNVQNGKMIVVNKNHPSTDFMDAEFIRKDEFYDIKNFNTDVNVLVKVDEKSYKDGKMGDNHPMAWFHEYDGGRAFYTNWGHTNETFSEPVALKHIWGGMSWAASGGDMNWDKARSKPAPEDNRFIIKELDKKLDEPTELAVTNDGRVFYTERKGKMKMFDPKNGEKKVIAEFNVYTGFEYGLMGINIDPNFDKNKWIYAYYSPPSGQPDTAQRLSRFVFDEAKQQLDMASEKIIMRVPVKRTDCCHTGGSIDWDAQGNLYLSTGDDVNPFNSDGYGPIDERKGREGWDGRHTSSNTNDMRGKIHRIKPNDDGTYSIPEGNLFQKGTDKARPEIYVMGNRNPYRISVDKHTGYLYWGEVGPDAGENSKKYGPRGHDEVNQARQAGYFGWPLFVADNRAYNMRSFEKDTTGAKFDPKKPINDSPHNTGLRELPPAQKAFIYYPYVESPEFGEIVGKGGRNAMAGPVYYAEDYKDAPNRFPEYFQGKFFAYDWMRDMINLVSMKPNGDFDGMERFLPKQKFSHPMDMQFGKDGSLYILEYGQNWFAQNDDARLIKITYNPGNRAPVAVASTDKTASAAPATITFSADGSMDHDGDPLSYEWNFDGKKKSKLPKATFKYKKAGVYKPTLTVKDSKGNKTVQTLEVTVGNEPPQVELAIKGNKTFYWSGEKINYEVKVSDKEDGSLANKTIKEDEVYVSINHLEGFDKTMIAQGHQQNLGVSRGQRLIELSDCKSCHNVKEKSIGPNYTDIAKKYKGAFMIVGKLSDKIIKGGGGVWGEQAMAAHPQISKDDATEMVNYIMSLADDKAASKPVSGAYVAEDKGKGGTYIVSASYSDKGAQGIGSQSNSQNLVLRNASFKATSYDDKNGVMDTKVEPIGDIVVALSSGSYISFKGIDLTQLTAMSVLGAASDDRTAGGTVEIRLNSPTGELIGSGAISKTPIPTPVRIPFKMPISGTHDVYLVFVNPDPKGKPLFALMNIGVDK
jgi:cytochrome c